MHNTLNLKHRWALITLALLLALAAGGRAAAGPRTVAVNWNSNVIIIAPQG